MLIGFLTACLLFPRETPTDRDLLLRSGILGREEPEEQLVGVVLVLTDGQETGVGLANVEVHVWEGASINGEFYYYMPKSVRVRLLTQNPPREFGSGLLLDFSLRNVVVWAVRGAFLVNTGCATALWGAFKCGLCIAARAVEAPRQTRRGFEKRMVVN